MPEQVEENQGGDTETPCLVGALCLCLHLFMSLCLGVSVCLCSLCVSPGLPLAHHYDSLLGAKREHIGLDFESESEKLGQD